MSCVAIGIFSLISNAPWRNYRGWHYSSSKATTMTSHHMRNFNNMLLNLIATLSKLWANIRINTEASARLLWHHVHESWSISPTAVSPGNLRPLSVRHIAPATAEIHASKVQLVRGRCSIYQLGGPWSLPWEDHTQHPVYQIGARHSSDSFMVEQVRQQRKLHACVHAACRWWTIEITSGGVRRWSHKTNCAMLSWGKWLIIAFFSIHVLASYKPYWWADALHQWLYSGPTMLGYKPILTQYPHHLQTLIASQNRLGWQHLVNGQFSQRWSDHQDEHYFWERAILPPTRKSGLMLQTGLINLLWDKWQES